MIICVDSSNNWRLKSFKDLDRIDGRDPDVENNNVKGCYDEKVASIGDCSELENLSGHNANTGPGLEIDFVHTHMHAINVCYTSAGI